VTRKFAATPSAAAAFLIATTGYASAEKCAHAQLAGFDE
jgi:hypothetical protein